MQDEAPAYYVTTVCQWLNQILSIGSVEEELSSGSLNRLISTQWTIFWGTPKTISVRGEIRRHQSFEKQNS